MQRPTLPILRHRQRRGISASKPRPKIYKCAAPGCKRAFDRPSLLNQHDVTHTGDKPFICSLCEDKRYTRASNLYRHMRICPGDVHRDSGSEVNEFLPTPTPTPSASSPISSSSHLSSLSPVIPTRSLPYETQSNFTPARRDDLPDVRKREGSFHSEPPLPTSTLWAFDDYVSTLGKPERRSDGVSQPSFSFPEARRQDSTPRPIDPSSNNNHMPSPHSSHDRMAYSSSLAPPIHAGRSQLRIQLPPPAPAHEIPLVVPTPFQYTLPAFLWPETFDAATSPIME